MDEVFKATNKQRALKSIVCVVNLAVDISLTFISNDAMALDRRQVVFALVSWVGGKACRDAYIPIECELQ